MLAPYHVYLGPLMTSERFHTAITIMIVLNVSVYNSEIDDNADYRMSKIYNISKIFEKLKLVFLDGFYPALSNNKKLDLYNFVRKNYFLY